MMTLLEGFIRFFAGGTFVLLITLLGKTKNEFLSGLFIVFPVAVLIGYYFLSFEYSPQVLKKTVFFSIYSFPVMIAFIVTLYFTVESFPILKALGISLLVWFLTAVLMLFLKKLIGF
jgi:uncharacterized membrane protein (GlpM family)